MRCWGRARNWRRHWAAASKRRCWARAWAGLPDALAQHGADQGLCGRRRVAGGLLRRGLCQQPWPPLHGKTEPAIILVGATAMGRDLAPRLAAKLGVGLASDCVALEIDDGRLVATRPIFAGKALAKVKLNGDPQMATLRPNVLAAPEPDAGAAATVEPVAAVSRRRAGQGSRDCRGRRGRD